jgi:tRNA 2-thiouridine synthesizing protein A
MSERLLDARGLKCPLPVMMAAKVLRTLPSGDLLRVLATDPLAPQDFRDFCASQGHEFVEASEAAGAFACLIRALARP